MEYRVIPKTYQTPDVLRVGGRKPHGNGPAHRDPGHVVGPRPNLCLQAKEQLRQLACRFSTGVREARVSYGGRSGMLSSSSWILRLSDTVPLRVESRLEGSSGATKGKGGETNVPRKRERSLGKAASEKPRP